MSMEYCVSGLYAIYPKQDHSIYIYLGRNCRMLWSQDNSSLHTEWHETEMCYSKDLMEQTELGRACFEALQASSSGPGVAKFTKFTIPATAHKPIISTKKLVLFSIVYLLLVTK